MRHIRRKHKPYYFPPEITLRKPAKLKEDWSKILGVTDTDNLGKPSMFLSFNFTVNIMHWLLDPFWKTR